MSVPKPQAPIRSTGSMLYSSSGSSETTISGLSLVFSALKIDAICWFHFLNRFGPLSGLGIRIKRGREDEGKERSASSL
jgi:hypothetical protein